jgi:hypothetical protein
MNIPNLRKAEYTTKSGKDVKDTMMLSGEAKSTKAFKETNSTSQYTSGKSSFGSLGGENTNS